MGTTPEPRTVSRASQTDYVTQSTLLTCHIFFLINHLIRKKAEILFETL